MFHLNFLSILDSFRKESGALSHYKKKLHEFQEQEAEVLIDIGVIYLDRGEVDKAIKNFEEALGNYRKLKFSEGEAYALELLGDCHLIKREFKTAMSEYSSAFSIYTEIGSPLVDELKEKIYEAEKIQQALNYAGKSQKNGKENSVETELSSEEAKILEDMEPIFKLSDKLLSSIEIFSEYDGLWGCRDMGLLMENLESARVIRDRTSEAMIYLLIGKLNLEMGNFDEALKYIKRSHRLFKEIEDQVGEAVSLMILGIILFIMDERENLYNVFKDAIEVFSELELEDTEKTAIDIVNALSKI